MTAAAAITISGLRRLAVGRTFFTAPTIEPAVIRFGFLQADPIRAPARAQDLTLRHRVAGYRAGDLERLYPTLAIEEDFFVNYGFVPRGIHALMHPRSGMERWSRQRRTRAEALLAFVRERGAVHPREVDAWFAHGTVTNYWGGASSATTHLLDAMHYRGLLRVARRDGGIRVYAAREPAIETLDLAARRARVDALVDVIVQTYGPLPAASLWGLVYRLRFAVPQWQRDLKPALQRATTRLSHAQVDGVHWYWPAGEPAEGAVDDTVRLLAPFDPLVWDRRRFELLWNWKYRFEAYTPAAKRTLGYYALPLLWRDQVIGWANVTSPPGGLEVQAQYVAGKPPRLRAFTRALDAEIERMRAFLR